MKTIKQLAEETGVSKQAIRKKIANLGLQTSLQKIGNQFAIDEQQEKLIKSSFVDKNRKPVTDNQTTTDANQFAFFEQEIERLHNQLNAKDRQLSERDKQLSEMTKLLDQQQQLQLGVQKQLEAKTKKWTLRLPWAKKKE